MTNISIERTEDSIVIKLPADASAEFIQNVLNYIQYAQIGAGSNITEAQVEKLASEAKAGWWEKNKARFDNNIGLDQEAK